MGDPAMKTWQLRAGLVAGAVALACSITISDLGAQGWATAVPTQPAWLEGLFYRPLTVFSRGGRVTAVAGVPSDPQVYYMGAAGGVFKTTDAGATWEPMTDGQIGVGSIGAIAVSRVQPERHLRRHRLGVSARQRLARRRRVQVHRRRQDVAAHRPARRPGSSAASASIRRIPTSCTSRCSATSSARTRSAASIARRTAARPGSRCSSVERPHRRRRPHDGRRRIPNVLFAGDVDRRSGSRGRSTRAAPKAGSSGRPTAATTGRSSPTACRRE